MRRRFLSVVALIFAAACGVADNSSITEPTTIQRPLVASPDVVQACNVSFATLYGQLQNLFADASNDETSALSKLNSIQQQLNNGNLAGARVKAWDLVGFIQQKKTKNTFLGDADEIATFNRNLFCFVGYGPNSFLIYPSDDEQTLVTDDELAGVKVPANNVAVPTLLTINPLASAPPLDTKLDIHPLYYDFAITNEAGAGAWLADVVVGVCATTDSDVLQYLLLGHQSDTGFELLDPEPVPFLDCDGTGGSGNVSMNLAGDSLVALAAGVIGSAGVGGSTDDFSPIAPVDGRVVGSSGAGGGADDFRPRRGMTPSMNLVSLPSVVCSLPIQAVIGTEVAPECRPSITFETPTNHTPIAGVNVAWAVENNASVGSISTPSACNPFANSLALQSNASGVTTVCWKLGGTPGTNTVTATASPGGEAPDGVTFVYAEGGVLDTNATVIRFTATSIRIDPTAGATGASGSYTGSAFTGSGTCGPNPPLTPVLSYNTGDGNAPVNVGTYTLTVTCGVAGDPNDIYTTQTAQATITITQASSTTTVNCPATASFTGQPLTPCTAAATGAGGLNAPLTVNYTNNTLVGTATATAAYAGDANHTGSNGSATFTINNGYVQIGCFSSPIFNVMPPTKSAQNKGSNLQLKCTLKWPNGTVVTNATGNLQVYDLGPGLPAGGTPQPPVGAVPLSVPNAFKATSSGNYSYGLDTTPLFFVKGNGYLVRALWSDGSKTEGYFLLK